MLFESYQSAYNADDYHIKEHHFPIRAYGFLPSVHAPRTVHYKRNLCKLGRLEQIVSADNEPTLEIAVAVKNKHEYQKNKRDRHRQERKIFIYSVIYPRSQKHKHYTQQRKFQLASYIVIRAAVPVYSVDIARRKQGYQSNDEQDDDEQEELCIYLPESQHFSLAAPFDAARGVSVKRIVLPEQLARRRYPRILFSCSPAFRGLSLSL